MAENTPIIVSEALGLDRLLHRKAKLVDTHQTETVEVPSPLRVPSYVHGGPQTSTTRKRNEIDVVIRAFRWTDKLEVIVQIIETGEIVTAVLGSADGHGVDGRSRHTRTRSLILPVNDLMLLGEESLE